MLRTPDLADAQPGQDGSDWVSTCVCGCMHGHGRFFPPEFLDTAVPDLMPVWQPHASAACYQHACRSKLVQYLSAASICSPSRASLMTGRMFTRIGIWPGVLSPLSVGGLPLNETTVASALRSVGWTTGMLGKWHLGTNEYHPTHHGFDFYFGAHMTQNECVSNIVSPGAALLQGANAPYTTGTGREYGPCPIFNGSTSVPSVQRNLLAGVPELLDMDDIDELYDDAAARCVGASARALQPVGVSTRICTLKPVATPRGVPIAWVRSLTHYQMPHSLRVRRRAHFFP